MKSNHFQYPSKSKDQMNVVLVHIRTTRVDRPHDGVSYSYISSAAVKFGNNIIEVSDDGNLVINGAPSQQDIDSHHADDSVITLDGHTLTRSTKGTKGRITVFELDLDDNKIIRIRCNTKLGMIYVDIEGHFPNTVGLLGAPAGEDGRLLSRDKSLDMTNHWNSFGEDWQVRDTDPMLFTDKTRFPQYPMGCVYEASSDSNRNLRRRLRAESEVEGVTLDVAREACAKRFGDLNQFCIDDVMATGDVELAEDPFYA